MEKVKVKPRKKPSKIEEMTKEQIRQAIVKKRECNTKAQNIVESLLDKDITEAYFLNCLPDINQSHFEDVIEERAIVHLCGYPICQKILTEKDIPKQKYRISIKTNKVYDITTRKSFCSNSCYKSAMYVKQQMLTSPLWFREYEEIPKFHLLPLDCVGSLGDEVDLSIVKRVNIKSNNEELFTSINDFASASLNEIKENQDSDGKKRENIDNVTSIIGNLVIDEKVTQKTDMLKEDKTLDKTRDSEITLIDSHNNIENESTSNKSQEKSLPLEESTEKTPKIMKTKSAPNPLNIVGEIIEKPERKIDPILSDTLGMKGSKPIILSAKKLVQKKQPSAAVITIEVEKCLAEWFTLDTLLYLFGEEKVKEVVSDKGECIKEYLNNYSKSIFYMSNTYDQYQTLCRKLNLLELEDRKFDSQTLNRETKPLPDYTIIKEESKKMQLKVKAFLAGETQIPDAEISHSKKSPTEEDHITQLPLIDKNAQNAIRRKIVCEHLNKVLPDLLRSLGLLTLSISSDVRLIVNTFKLKANNITFKPIQWTLIAIVIIKLLSIRDKRLEYLLKQQMAYEHMQLLLLSYKQNGGYLDRLILWLTDIDRLLDTNDTQMTIE